VFNSYQVRTVQGGRAVLLVEGTASLRAVENGVRRSQEQLTAKATPLMAGMTRLKEF
jgi:hypothetical protein